MLPENYQSSSMNSVKLQDTKLIQESVTFLYTNNERQRKEIKKTIPFIIASKRKQHLGINLTKKVKDLENYKTLMKEIEDDTNGLEELILLK